MNNTMTQKEQVEMVELETTMGILTRKITEMQERYSILKTIVENGRTPEEKHRENGLSAFRKYYKKNIDNPEFREKMRRKSQKSAIKQKEKRLQKIASGEIILKKGGRPRMDRDLGELTPPTEN